MRKWILLSAFAGMILVAISTGALWNGENGTAGVCLLACVVLFSYPHVRTPLSIGLLRLAVVCILVLSSISLMGSLLRLDFLYNWLGYQRTSVLSSLAAVSLGLGLLGLLRRRFPRSSSPVAERRILALCSAILLGVAAAGVLAGFSLFAKASKVMLANHLQQALTDRAHVFEDSIKQHTDVLAAVSLDNALRDIIQHPHKNLPQNLKSFFNSRAFASVKIINTANQVIYNQGRFTKQQLFYSDVESLNQTKIFWQNGWILQLKTGLFNGKQAIGSIVAEWPLVNINHLYIKQTDLGQTGSFRICTHYDLKHALCSPRYLTENLQIIPLEKNHEPTSANLALAKLSGSRASLDQYNHPLLSVYSPMQFYDLAIVTQMNTAELYAPIRDQLQTLLPVLIAVLSLGCLLLYWQVSPLIKKLVLSEKKTRNINTRLKLSEERFRAAFDSAAIGMALVGLDGHWLKVNSALVAILHYSEAELLTMYYQDTLTEDCQARYSDALASLLGSTSVHRCLEQRLQIKMGKTVWTSVNISVVKDQSGSALYFIFQIQDIDAQKEAEWQLKQMAFQDPLTALANRAQIEKNIQAALANVTRDPATSFALIFLDLDHFKNINDTYGHDAGDDLLKIIAQRLLKSVAEKDSVGRLAGDEFIILINDSPKFNDLTRVAENILSTFAQPIALGKQQVFVTASIGISLYPHDGIDGASLLKAADMALYRAKEYGKNNFKFFNAVES